MKYGNCSIGHSTAITEFVVFRMSMNVISVLVYRSVGANKVVNEVNRMRDLIEENSFER